MGIDLNQAREWGLNPRKYSDKSSSRSNLGAITSKTDSLNPIGQDEIIKRWGSMVQRKLTANVLGLFRKGKDGTITRPDGKKEEKLSESIRVKYGKTFGTIDRVSFSFPRHGVFVHKGVGRGWPITGGMVIKTIDQAKEMGETRNPRKPVEWFNPIIEARLPELADQLAKINADALINSTKILIK